MMLEAEEIDHKGYRLEVARFGPGARVLIFRPNAGLLLPETPYCDHMDERDNRSKMLTRSWTVIFRADYPDHSRGTTAVKRHDKQTCQIG